MEIIDVFPWDLDYPHPTEILIFTPNIPCHICGKDKNVKQGEITTEKTEEKRFWKLCSACFDKGWRLAHREMQDWELFCYHNKLTNKFCTVKISE